MIFRKEKEMLTVEQITCMETFALNFRTILFGKLEAKTAWGKEETKKQFEIALNEAVIKTVKDALTS